MGCGWWGGWRVVGVLVLVLGFWLGLGSGVGVSGGWGCLAGGFWFVGGGWCGVWGAAPLRPLLNSRPHLLGVLWFLVRVVPLLGGGVCWLVGVCGLRFFSGGVGWPCGWFVLLVAFWLGCSQPGVVVAVLAGLLRFGCVFVGGVSWWRALWVVSVSGGCSQAGCVVPVGWADLDGRALRRPPFPPHGTRRTFPDPQIQWVNSHVKTLTDRRSSVSGTHAFRLCRAV